MLFPSFLIVFRLSEYNILLSKTPSLFSGFAVCKSLGNAQGVGIIEKPPIMPRVILNPFFSIFPKGVGSYFSGGFTLLFSTINSC